MKSLKSFLFIAGLFLGGYGLGFDQIGVQFMSLFFMVSITYLFFKSFEKQDKEYFLEQKKKADINAIKANHFSSALDILEFESNDLEKLSLAKKLIGSWQSDKWGIVFQPQRECKLFFSNSETNIGTWSVEDNSIINLNYYILADLTVDYRFEVIQIIEGTKIVTKDLTNNVGLIETLYSVKKVIY